MVRVERMEKARTAMRMRRGYCSAFSLAVWIRACGGEGWESMLPMPFKVTNMFRIDIDII